MTAALRTPLGAAKAEPMLPGEFILSRDDFRRISQMIYADAGIHLTEGKAALVYARLAKRLRALRMEAFRDYCDLVSAPEGKGERQEMLTALTTNVTRFFREPHHFEHLKNRVLLGEARTSTRLRLWSAACSTGQEPYSMAMTLLSALPDAVERGAKILATDIDRNVLATAEAGVYSEDQLEGVSADQRRRFFEPAGSGLRVNAQLRKLITFRQLNLVEPFPMTGKFQAIFCRNVVIYFDEPTQQEIWRKFVPLLAREGALYIGHSERVTGSAAPDLCADGVSTYRIAGGRR